jgi:hypothetical protein
VFPAAQDNAAPAVEYALTSREFPFPIDDLSQGLCRRPAGLWMEAKRRLRSRRRDSRGNITGTDGDLFATDTVETSTIRKVVRQCQIWNRIAGHA